jgi:hypothetical protein
MTAVDQHTPNWAPLESVIPLDDCADWMWMSRLEHGGRPIEQYKHRDTRQYLNLDAEGNAYRVEYPTTDWDPWCGVPLAEVAQLPPTVEPVPFVEALGLALS